jgi:hypothetical protein
MRQVLGWTLVNSTVALAGYYFSAFTVDKRWMGRRRLQVRAQCSGFGSGLYKCSGMHAGMDVRCFMPSCLV